MSDLAGLAFWLGCIICWLNAVIHDIGNNLLLWTVADFIIAPLGVLRGLILFFN